MMSNGPRGGRLLPTPPRHLMLTRPERPVKKSKKKKKEINLFILDDKN